MHSASLSLSVSVLLTFISFKASALYDVVDPGAVFSDATCEAYAINRKGTVVGLCRTNLGIRAFLWSEDRGSIDLSLVLGDVSAAAYGINDSEEVVGQMVTQGGYWHAFLWSDARGTVDLGTFEGGMNSCALGINNSSVVAGCSDLGGPVRGTCRTFGNNLFHAFVWQESSGMQDLGTLGGPYSEASGINEVGQLVGWSALSPGVFRPFVYDGEGGMQPLEGATGNFSKAYAINSFGQIVGLMDYAPFLYDNSGLQYLAPQGVATGINDVSVVVGQRQDALGHNNAYVYSGGEWTELSTLVTPNSCWRYLLLANGLNDNGLIVGQGYCHGISQARAFVMIPVE